MPVAKVAVRGIEKINRNLQRVGREVDARFKLEALEKAAEPVRKRAEELAPKRTGRLARHMVIQKKIKSRIYTALVGPEKMFFYGYFNEYGTSKMAPSPFLRPAMAQMRDKALEILRNELRISAAKSAAKSQ